MLVIGIQHEEYTMPRTVHVTVTYSVHVEDYDALVKSGKLTDKDAMNHAENYFYQKGSIIDIKSKVHDKWTDVVQKVRKGIGSY